MTLLASRPLSCRRAGVTLIELMIALSTIAVLLGLTFILFQHAERSNSNVEAKVVRFSPELRKAKYRMQRDFDMNKKVPDQYIVNFKPSVRHPHTEAARIAKSVPAKILHVYRHAVKGVSVRIEPGLLPTLLADPAVAEVHQDHYLYPCVLATGMRRILYTHAPTPPPFFLYFPTGITTNSAGGNQGPRNLLGGNSGGASLKVVAVIDSGIDSTHPELNVTFSAGFGWPNGQDQSGHGTHVSGIIGARGIHVTGVLPGVPLWSLRALGPIGGGETGGTGADVLGALDYVAANATQISVCNMSIGGPADPTINGAVDACTAAGVVMCAAAGNSAIDASNFSPASAATAICVAAMCDTDGMPGHHGANGSFNDPDDTFTSFSDFGTTVTIIAPGEDILSTWPVSMGSYNTISGTSMATPHVSGMSAVVLASPGILTSNHGQGPRNLPGIYGPNNVHTPAQVRSFLLAESVETIPGLAANGDSLNYLMLAGRP
jgi:subtilisin